MENVSFYVYITFGTTLLLAIWLFFKASNHSKPFLILLMVWLIFQSLLAITGFYSNPDRMTERFPFLLLPSLLLILFIFITKKGRAFIGRMDLPTLIIFHIIRIPVEIVLFWLFVDKSIPEAMTFHGRNFDIFSGLSAPLVYYFGFVKNKLTRPVVIAWNFICLVLLLNVVSIALLSLPGTFGQFGFVQPNLALGYFPFILLPACLVPLAMFSHLAAIWQLFRRVKTKQLNPGDEI
jgi:hypothetical protein